MKAEKTKGGLWIVRDNDGSIHGPWQTKREAQTAIDNNFFENDSEQE